MKATQGQASGGSKATRDIAVVQRDVSLQRLESTSQGMAPPPPDDGVVEADQLQWSFATGQKSKILPTCSVMARKLSLMFI